MAPSGCGHCHPMIPTIHCASCGEHLGKTEPQFPCPTWHNDEEPYCFDPAYPGPEAVARQRAAKPNQANEDTTTQIPNATGTNPKPSGTSSLHFKPWDSPSPEPGPH
jgi:hypothetical protein